MKIETTRFGTIEVEEGEMLLFSRGLLGFPSLKRCAVLPAEKDSPFEWLQSCDDSSVAFPTANLSALIPGCKPKIHAQDIADLDAEEDQDFLLKVILKIPAQETLGATVNLKAPIVINPKNRKAKQVVLSDSSLSYNHPVFRS